MTNQKNCDPTKRTNRTMITKTKPKQSKKTLECQNQNLSQKYKQRNMTTIKMKIEKKRNNTGNEEKPE